MSERKVVVLHSGGLDSSTLLYHLRNLSYEVLPLSIHYGQRHWKELNAAAEVCKVGGFKFNRVELPSLVNVMTGSSQTDPSVAVPEGHYAEDNMAITVVPNRNMILLSIATAYAISQRAGWVAYAAHVGDHAQYYDCRQVFIDAMEIAIDLSDPNSPALLSPFAYWSKADIVRRAWRLEVPIAKTWSCYKGGEVHCGRCGTDVERAEAFFLAGVDDPTEYADPEYWKSVSKVSSREQDLIFQRSKMK